LSGTSLDATSFVIDRGYRQRDAGNAESFDDGDGRAKFRTAQNVFSVGYCDRLPISKKGLTKRGD